MILPTQINSLYKHIKTINIKELGIRKKLDVYIANDLKDQNSIIFCISQKSRFLQKDVDKIEEINNIITNSIQEQILSKVILIESPLCSKAQKKLENLQWKVII